MLLYRTQSAAGSEKDHDAFSKPARRKGGEVGRGGCLRCAWRRAQMTDTQRRVVVKNNTGVWEPGRIGFLHGGELLGAEDNAC
jgi:hypothetical protein